MKNIHPVCVTYFDFKIFYLLEQRLHSKVIIIIAVSFSLSQVTHSFSKYSLQTLFYYFVRTLKFCAYLLSLRLCISKKCQHERIDFNNQNHICLRNNKPSHKTITTMYKLWFDPFFL